ncbi:MAG: putative ABC transporter permease, partial [Lachnospiraceae bacterium]|nr:putative ABC transporter permease [Lachnospiraceae bacterium]
MLISKYCCLFFIYSLLGWIYECLFCTVKTGKWENRGFLIGPICPIYGTGAVLVTLLTGLFLPIGSPFSWMGALKIFLISFFGG